MPKDNLQDQINELKEQNQLLWRQISAGKKRRRYLLLVLAVAIPLAVFAASIPNTFVDGEIISAAKINANFQAAHPDCPSGFTDMTNGTYSLGCIQSSQQASNGNCIPAMTACFSLYGGRLPSPSELLTAKNVLGLSITPSSEWVDSVYNPGGAASCGVVDNTPTVGGDAATGDRGYRCFIPR